MLFEQKSNFSSMSLGRYLVSIPVVVVVVVVVVGTSLSQNSFLFFSNVFLSLHISVLLSKNSFNESY